MSLYPFGSLPDVNCTSVRLRSAVKELVQQNGDKIESKSMVLDKTTLIWSQKVPDSSHTPADDREADGQLVVVLFVFSRNDVRSIGNLKC